MAEPVEQRVRAPKRSAVGRALRIVLALSVVLVAAAFAARAWALHLVRRAVDDALAEASASIGRPIRVGRVDASIGTSIAIVLADVAVPGVAHEPNVIAARRVSCAVALWPIVRSRGHDITLRDVSLDDVHFTVVRHADGTFSTDAMRAAFAHRRSRPATPRDVSVEHLAADGMRFETILERADGTADHLALGPLRVRAEGMRAGGVASITVDGAALRSTGAIVAHGRIGAAGDLDLALRDLALDAAGGAFAHAHADAEARARWSASRIDATLDVRANGIAMPAPERPLDAIVRVDLALDRATDRLSLHSFGVRAGPITVDARGDIVGLFDVPRVEHGHLVATAVELGRLVHLVPQSAIPGATRLEGAASIEANGAPDHFDVALALSDARVEAGGLVKPAGMPCSIAVTGATEPGRVRVDRATLVLGPLTMRAHGAVAGRDNVDVAFESDDAPIEPLVRLDPSLQHALGREHHVAGRVRASGQVHRAADGERGELHVALHDTDASSAALTLHGAAAIDGRFDRHGSDLSVDFDADATGLAVRLPSRIDKLAGVPLHASLAAHRANGRFELTRALLDVPGLSVHATGHADLATHRLDVRAPNVRVDVAALTRVVPALAVRVPGAFADAVARFTLVLDGDPDSPRTAALHVHGADVTLPYGHVRADLDATGLDRPRDVHLRLRADVLDLDAIPMPGTIRPGARTPSRAAPPAWLADANIDVAVTARAIHSRDLDVAGLDAAGALSHGTMRIWTLHATVDGGHLVGDGSQYELFSPLRTATLHASVRDLDVAQLGPRDPEPSRQRTGRLDISVDGAIDTAAPHPETTARGTLRVDGRALVLPRTASVHAALIGSHAIRVSHPDAASDPIHVSTLHAAFDVASGVLTTHGEIEADTDDGPIRAHGTIRTDTTLALAGSIRLTADAIARATQNRFVPFGPVPVSVRISGNAGAPRLDLVDLGTTLRALAGSQIHGIGVRIRNAFRHTP